MPASVLIRYSEDYIAEQIIDTCLELPLNAYQICSWYYQYIKPFPTSKTMKTTLQNVQLKLYTEKEKYLQVMTPIDTGGTFNFINKDLKKGDTVKTNVTVSGTFTTDDTKVSYKKVSDWSNSATIGDYQFEWNQRVGINAEEISSLLIRSKDAEASNAKHFDVLKQTEKNFADARNAYNRFKYKNVFEAQDKSTTQAIDNFIKDDKFSRGTKIDEGQYKVVYADAFNSGIPAGAQAMYTKAPNWDPQIYPENYVECVAFVAMAYNMSGTPITTTMGNAKDWIGYTKEFNVFHTGGTTEIPQVGDVMVWSGGDTGHVAVVVDVDLEKKSFRVANANVPTVTQKYSYSINSSNKKVSIVSAGWIPDYWLRKK